MARASLMRRLEGPLEIFTPYMPGNRAFLNSLAARPGLAHVSGGNWTIRRSLFSHALRSLVGRFGVVDLFTEHRKTQRCNASCVNATGEECVCSCNYRNHKVGMGGMFGWTLIDETLIKEEVDLVHHIVRR